MTDKPVIFISHSSKDGELARILKQYISLCFSSSNTPTIFASDINTGENWFEKVMDSLDSSEAIITLITPNSVNDSHWVWFELGYFWAKHKQALKETGKKEKVYYPLCIDGTEWPNPVKDLQIQAALLLNKQQARNFFQGVCEQFSGNINEIDFDRFIAELSACRDSLNQEAVKEEDVALPNINVSHNAQNAGEELVKERLFDYLKAEFWKNPPRPPITTATASNLAEYLFPDEPKGVYSGEYISFDEWDRKLRMLTGTSKQYLAKVATSNFRLEIIPPVKEYGIRFKYKWPEHNLNENE